MSEFLADHRTSNLVILLLVASAIAVARVVRKNDIWRQAFRQLWRRRPIAIAVFSVYVLVAMADSIAWIGGEHQASVEAYEAKSLIDRVFGTKTERSYSAPFADKEFVGGKELKHPKVHPFGTDILGRDVLYVMLKGARVALLIGGLTSLIAIPLALFFGVIAGYFGKRVDDVVFFIMSTLASMPSILLRIALIMVLPKGTLSVCIALGVTSWVGFCRLARGETMKLREMDYVNAAKALGASHVRIIWRHIIPNLMHLVIIRFVLLFSGLVLSEAVLAWLGIGIDGSWGQMIAQAKNELSRDPLIWWNIVAAFIGQFGLLLSVNIIGDGVRDVLDPRTLREEH